MSLRCLNTVKFYFTKSKMTSLKILKERNNLAFDKIEKKSKKGLPDYGKVDILFKIESLF